MRLRLRSWRLPLAVASAACSRPAGWPCGVEPAGSEITAPGTDWWYFVVTAAPVVYGDFMPISTGGHVVGVCVIIGGIVTLTLLCTQLATALETMRASA